MIGNTHTHTHTIHIAIPEFPCASVPRHIRWHPLLFHRFLSFDANRYRGTFIRKKRKSKGTSQGKKKIQKQSKAKQSKAVVVVVICLTSSDDAHTMNQYLSIIYNLIFL